MGNKLGADSHLKYITKNGIQIEMSYAELGTDKNFSKVPGELKVSTMFRHWLTEVI